MPFNDPMPPLDDIKAPSRQRRLSPYDDDFRVRIQDIFAQRIAAFSRSVMLECELTTRCLNDCSYCGADIREQQGEVDFGVLTGHLTAYAAHAEEKGSEFMVSLVGGDPVLYSQFDALLTFLAERGLRYIVKGNASTLSRKRAERLQVTGCVGLKLTCYGDEEMHNAHRGLDTFRLLADRTNLARSLGLPVVWHLSVGKENLDAMRRALPVIRDMNLEGISEGRIGKIGRLADAGDYDEMTPQAWREFLLDLLHFYHQHRFAGFNLGFRDKLWVPLLVEEGLLDLAPFRGQGIRLGCDLYSDMATVDFRGYLKGCGLIESAQKQVVFHPAAEKRTVYLASETTTLNPDSVCAACDYRDFCRGCRAITLASTGDMNAQDPQCWVNRLEG